MGHLSHDDHVSQSHFSFSQRLVLRIWGCVLVFSGFFLCRRVTFVTCRDRESWWWFFCSHSFLFWLENTMYCLCIMMRLFTNDGCGDYHQVRCVAFFSKTSILVVSFGLHQWIKLVDLILFPRCTTSFHSDGLVNWLYECDFWISIRSGRHFISSQGGFSWSLFWQTVQRSRSAGPSMLVGYWQCTS